MFASLKSVIQQLYYQLLIIRNEWPSNLDWCNFYLTNVKAKFVDCKNVKFSTYSRNLPRSTQ
jgi:hypothetical protein